MLTLKIVEDNQTETVLNWMHGKCTVQHLGQINIMQLIPCLVMFYSLVRAWPGLTACIFQNLGVVLNGGLTFGDHVTHEIQRASGQPSDMYRSWSMLCEPIIMIPFVILYKICEFIQRTSKLGISVYIYIYKALQYIILHVLRFYNSRR